MVAASRVVLALLFAADVAALSAPTAQTALAATPKHDYKKDCGRRHGKSLLQKPGTGMTPEALQPFDMVYKDGFFHVGCYMDYMYVHGDKFGDNKFSYEVGPISNVSITHYEALVPREDQKPMTHEACFEFCRTLPDTAFFGLVNGRDCYCTPYYKPMESDSSECDAFCEGNQGTFCGGKSKSSIFEMHSCMDTGAELTSTADSSLELATDLLASAEAVNSAAIAVDARANELQQTFGQAGDPTMSNLLQDLQEQKKWGIHGAGNIVQFAQAMKATATSAQSLSEDTATLVGASKVEATTKSLEAQTTTAEQHMEELQAFKASTTPTLSNASGAGEQYYPAMYFIDKEFDEVPSTCGGDVQEIMYNTGYDGCAAACDMGLVAGCLGFQFVPGTDGPTNSMCFLFTKLNSITYYAGCAKGAAFLQRDRDPAFAGDKAMCLAKFSRFEGTTLAPDGSGKCDQCVKEATKADRCFSLK